MPEIQGLTPAQMRVSCVCLAIGAVTLAWGIHMGFTKDSGSIIAIVLLGSVVLFAVALWPFLKLYKFPLFNFNKASPPAAKTEPQPEVQAQPEATSKVQAGAKSEIEPEVKPIPPAKAEPQPRIDAKTDVAKLMNTTLGELLLAALTKDPEAAGRFVAQAISRAQES